MPPPAVARRFSVLCLFLVISVRCSNATMDKDLERKLNETMSKQVSPRYTPLNSSTLQVHYNASANFNPKGMGQLYNITNMFIDLVQPKQAYPEGLIKLSNGSFQFADVKTEWRLILGHYGGLGGLAIVCLLIAAILPCVALFFCCCRCAGHCGARSEPFDKKHDHCRKIMLSTVLILIAAILPFGVVCAFVTNEYMQDGTRDLPSNAKTSLNDVQTYLAATKSEIQILLKVNYDELEVALNDILQASGKIVTDQLAESSHAVSLMTLNDIVEDLASVSQDLRLMNDITRDLRSNASRLDNFVRKVKTNLLQTLTKCATQDCKDLMHKYKINQMEVKVHFDKLPDNDVNIALSNISNLLDDNIVQEVSKGKEQFMNIQKEIQQAVNKTIPIVSASIRRAGDSLTEQAKQIMQLIDRLNLDIRKKYIPQLDVARRYIDQYSPYRYYSGLSTSCVLLMVLMCLTFGLCCGICGKRPDGYGDDCCNKGSGARFLMLAVWIIFLQTSILLIATVAHMVTGVLTERAVCEPLRNPNNNRMFELIDEFLDIKKVLYPKNPNADINMSYILTHCHKNESIYKVLKLQYIVNVESLRGYIDQYQINDTIHQLENRISLSHNYKIISESAREKLTALAESGLSAIKFDQFTDNLRDNITNIHLDHLAVKLRELRDRLPPGNDDIRDDLEKNAFDLEVYHKSIVVPMTNLSNQLSDKAVKLQEHLKFNHSSLAAAIPSLIKKVDKAQVFISQEGPEHVKALAAEFGKAFLYQVNSYLNYVIGNVFDNIGKCGPISNAYNATIVAGCNKILDPFNGFWLSVGWSSLLLIPTIILCVKLSTLYQKSDPYPGPLVEAEYLYDAYADRDNVPLAHSNRLRNIHDKKYANSRHHNHPGGGYPESYDGPGMGYGDRERMVDVHQGSSHHESRYSDLAPKNWDFSNSGPPRYQPAVAPPLSTEYERPPPYYYPGPGDRN
ncbi:prominin-like protein isoform X2 [Phymastichus coffea]|uniref:prominin-like protein isoform X2 n=1 Tax=Phymastichus coffea TaxID=108790 RepID=UPI00273B584D|nr:prominin-like protein isoform X2 [Phymastichus coffea]